VLIVGGYGVVQKQIAPEEGIHALAHSCRYIVDAYAGALLMEKA